MARPRTFDPTAAETSMLDVFWRNGYLATSIPDLTTATGLLPGSLYAAFGSKEAMFETALKRYRTWLAAQLRTESKGLDAIDHILNTIVRITIEDAERRGCPMINAIPEGQALSPGIRGLITDGMGSLRRLFRARLAEADHDRDSALTLEELEAMLFSASVSIRVLGRAGLPAALLRDIASATLAAVRQSLQPSPKQDAINRGTK